MTLAQALEKGGVIEYRNGIKGVRLKCGWWQRVLSRPEDGETPKKLQRPRKIRYTKKERIIAGEIMAKKAADPNGDEWWDEWTEFCFKKVFK